MTSDVETRLAALEMASQKCEQKCAENASELSRCREYSDALAWNDMSATYKSRADALTALLAERAAHEAAYGLALALRAKVWARNDEMLIKLVDDLLNLFPAAPQPKGPEDE